MDPENPHDPAEWASGTAPARAAGIAVARARRDAGMTQRELAERLGERQWMVEEWEAGRQSIPPEKLDAIARTTGVAVDLLGLPTGASHRERVIGAEAERWIRSLGSMNEPLPNLTVDQIRDSELPRSLRGFDEGATRRRLAEIADLYGRLIAERDELRRRLEEVEAAPPVPADHEQVVAERDELRRRVAELAAAAGRDEDLVAERDRLRARIAELEASAEERTDYDEIVTARARLEREVGELTELLSSRDDYDAIVAERDELRHRLTEAEARGETEQALSRALLAASRAGEELVKEAQAEADAIVAAARGSVAETERELEERRRAFESERESFLESLRVEALHSARADLAALQQEAEPLVGALAAFTRRIRTIIKLQLETTDDKPLGELLEDLQARAEPSGATRPFPE